VAKSSDVGMGIMSVLSDAGTGSRSFTPKSKPSADRIAAALSGERFVRRGDYYSAREKAEREYKKNNPGKAGMTAINAMLRDMMANSEGMAKAVGVDVLAGDVQFDRSGGTVTLRFNVRDPKSSALTWQGDRPQSMLGFGKDDVQPAEDAELEIEDDQPVNLEERKASARKFVSNLSKADLRRTARTAKDMGNLVLLRAAKHEAKKRGVILNVNSKLGKKLRPMEDEAPLPKRRLLRLPSRK
jgi:hypothetical protein